ncbi:MAG: oxidoreductase, partial [Kytococcus sp.]|nr:oxidoreductase [Kytococcus sp.]
MSSPEHPRAPSRPTLRIGVVGAGRVGAVLGAALRAAGHEVVAVSAVSEESVERAEMLLPGVPVAPVPQVVEAAQLVLLAVPDDALTDLVAGLHATGTWRPGQLVAHTSGRHGLAPFAPVAADLLPMAIHPAMTFTGTSLDLARLSECCFGITTPQALRPVAEALVVEMGGEPVWVAEEARGRYHAALAHGSNHMVTLVAQAMEILRSAGIEPADRVLRPLLQASLDNALSSGDAALTGPVARGDAGTVAAHLDELAGLAEDLRPAYLAQARATALR